jgi:hypothetical protein
MKEGWVEFIRFQCLEGHIDVWIGDAIDDPNLPDKNRMHLNATAKYFRLNNGKWIRDRKFHPIFFLAIRHRCEEETAEAIWKEYIRE